MSASVVDICNIALSRVGVKERINTLDAPARSEEQRLFMLFYERVLHRTLGQYPWYFATKRATLVLLETDPTTEWHYRYAVPSDMERPQYIEGGRRNQPTEELVKWQLEGSDDGSTRTLLTDQASPVLVYTSRSASTVIYPEYFTNLLAWNLASEIAMPLTAKADIGNMAMNAARIALLDARTSALREQQPDDALESEFVRARE
jgi:hypothetical protein